MAFEESHNQGHISPQRPRSLGRIWWQLRNFMSSKSNKPMVAHSFPLAPVQLRQYRLLSRKGCEHILTS